MTLSCFARNQMRQEKQDTDKHICTVNLFFISGTSNDCKENLPRMYEECAENKIIFFFIAIISNVSVHRCLSFFQFELFSDFF